MSMTPESDSGARKRKAGVDRKPKSSTDDVDHMVVQHDLSEIMPEHGPSGMSSTIPGRENVAANRKSRRKVSLTGIGRMYMMRELTAVDIASAPMLG